MEPLSPQEIRELVKAVLAEDVGAGDVTSLATIPESARTRALMVAREALVVAGLALAEAVFREASSEIVVMPLAQDGQRLNKGQTLLRLAGPTRAILGAERVALNFVQRLSGIATLTARYVQAIHGTGAQILDTRKTTPGWRRLEKYAVTCGGGGNHRFGLFDMILIKDNHLAALAEEKPNPIAAAIWEARAEYPKLRIEVEVETLEQVQQAIAAGADVLLLDNMSVERMREAVRLVNKRRLTEASGGVTLDAVRPIAETGVNFISVGALTHSAPAADIALDVQK